MGTSGAALGKSPANVFPRHVRGLLSYLSQPDEKANEDLALAYFREVFGESFVRQKDAKLSDGYVPGSFVLELKGKTNNWLAGLFQGLAYKNRGLDFSQIVVGAKDFLAVWRVEDLPNGIREEIISERASPSRVGPQYAKKYASKKHQLLKLAVWNGSELSAPLILAQTDVALAKLSSFEKTIKDGKKVRRKVTTRNFPTLLKEMVQFFPPDQPIKAVRAFYSMIYAWSETSTVNISQKNGDRAALGGETITSLLPGKRLRFKEFVEQHHVLPDTQGNYDEYFARFDEALDAADKNFRIKNGIFFTDLDLSRFVMWFVRQYIPELGKDYLVIDPACGSGNLVTNWRSPLELRHKVVSEIEPKLLFAVERRMKGDAWHNGKFTVVPKVSENRGLNFLDRSAAEYLDQIRDGLAEKGLSPDKPLAFLCNPPYRSDDDQTAGAIPYKIDQTILDLTGLDAGNERYCCFLAQMKLVCEAAKESGLPGDSLLLLFTKSTWLTKRPIFQHIRSQILGSFEHVAGALVQAREFFDVKGAWPVAFTVWRYKGREANLDATRSIELMDLTWVTKKHLSQIPWAEANEVEARCSAILREDSSRSVPIGVDRLSIREWSGGTMSDFKRDRRVSERNAKIAGGLPAGDHRQANKKAYGEVDGRYIGFMDDLTPCRTKNSIQNRPWLNVDSRFMAVKKSRCFSGPPTHLGYCASDLETSKRLFFWYALGRTFVVRPYPMWIDADGMWAPSIPNALERLTFQIAFAIAYAENECVETRFPAHNPVKGAPELFVENPFTPINPKSFWSQTLKPYMSNCTSSNARKLVAAVDGLFQNWDELFRSTSEITVDYKEPYFIGDGILTRTAGLVQIRDYANENKIPSLLTSLAQVHEGLSAAKEEFFEFVNQKLNYFGNTTSRAKELAIPTDSHFEKVICRRLAVAGLIVQHLHDEPNFGRTKLAKLFYLADRRADFQLQTEYVRAAAGPLDQRAFYSDRFGIEALAEKYGLFQVKRRGRMVRYNPLQDMDLIGSFAHDHLGNGASEVIRIARACRELTTDQSEIVATLYACWNDLLISKSEVTDNNIIAEFESWHPKKGRFPRVRLRNALLWMRQRDFLPAGRGDRTLALRRQSQEGAF